MRGSHLGSWLSSWPWVVDGTPGAGLEYAENKMKKILKLWMRQKFATNLGEGVLP